MASSWQSAKTVLSHRCDAEHCVWLAQPKRAKTEMLCTRELKTLNVRPQVVPCASWSGHAPRAIGSTAATAKL